MKKAIQLIERGTVKEFKAAFEQPETMMDLLVTDSLGLFNGTLLHYAVNYRKLSFVKYFVKLGADLESTLGAGHSPLYEAILSRSTTIGQYLVDAGANIQTRNAFNENLFYAIAKMRYGDRSSTKVKLLAFLIGLGLDVNERNTCGRTILFDVVLWDEPKVLTCLLDSGVSVNVVDQYGYTPLHIAAAKGWLSICQLLVEKGANMHVRNDYGWTPLDMASLHGKKVIVGFLGAEEAAFSDNNVALKIMQEALLEKEIAVLSLLPQLSNPNIYDYNQLSLLRLLVRDKAEAAVAILLQKEKVNLSGALVMACFKKNYSIVKLLLSHGADPNEANSGGSPFYNLFMFSNIDDELLKIAKLLVDNGGVINTEETNFRGNIVDLIRGQKSIELNKMLGIL
jgi:ankyrin repeat protein